MDPSLIDMESQGCPDHMEPLYAGSTRIDHKHIPFRISDNFQYMGMATNEYIRTIFINQCTRSWIISAGIASDMGHQNLHPFALEKAVKRVYEAQFMIVTIARHAHKGLE